MSGLGSQANGSTTTAQSIVALAQGQRFVIEDFQPLAESIEWDLGQRYLRERGSKAFISDATPVPFVINNDGNLSRTVAEAFFSSLVESESSGPLESRIFVLELGIGVGLFARFFLDTFRELCARHSKDYYRRLCYIAADRSEQMLADACRHGIFANHPGRYLIRVVDAMQPGQYLLGDASLPQGNPRPLRAVFLNYLLDCLPAAGLRIDDHEIRHLCVRTCLARNVDLAEFTQLTSQDIARRARSNAPRDQRALLELYGLFASEYDYRLVDVNKVPYGDFAVTFARSQTSHLLHNYGAIQSLEELLLLLHPQGLIFINDYGQTQLSQGDDIEHQRFSHATFVGINFPLLKAFFAGKGKYQWIEPIEESGRIHSRLLAHSIGPATAKFFSERFSKAAYDWLNEPLSIARAYVQGGRFEAALTAYHKALERQPSNWILMNELALFLTFTIRNPVAGIAMAKEALSLNPACSSELWNTLGDAYYERRKLAQAKNAYRRALAVNPRDVKARYNLAFVLVRERDYRNALEVIAEAMSLDDAGEYYDRLIKKQAEILSRLSFRNQQKRLLFANRVSKTPNTALRFERADADVAGAIPKEPPTPVVSTPVGLDTN